MEDGPHCHQEQKKEEVLLYNRLINSRTAAVACGLCQWWTITIREYVISQWHLRFFKPTTSSSLKMTFGLFSIISSSSLSQLELEGIAFFCRHSFISSQSQRHHRWTDLQEPTFCAARANWRWQRSCVYHWAMCCYLMSPGDIKHNYNERKTWWTTIHQWHTRRWFLGIIYSDLMSPSTLNLGLIWRDGVGGWP